jgi:uncharacterized protein
LELWQWGLGLLCAFLVGVAKTGVPGVGIVAIPLMVLAVGNAKLSAAWLLPVLSMADLFAVFYWRHHAAAGRLFSLAPWVLVGIVGGAAALSFPERVIRPMMGIIVAIMFVLFLVRRWRPAWLGASTHPAPYGVAAGFTTTVANAAGPVMNIYLLSNRLPKEEFLATGAWFFFLVNLSKVPIYSWHGMFSRQSLVFDAILAPAVLVGAVTGRWLVDHIPDRVFEGLVAVMTAVSIVLMFR